MPMLGMMFTDKECKEFDYLLRKEMDEMLLDMSDRRLDGPVKTLLRADTRSSFECMPGSLLLGSCLDTHSAFVRIETDNCRKKA